MKLSNKTNDSSKWIIKSVNTPSDTRYGYGQPQLDASVAIRWASSSGGSAVGNFTFNSTGNISVTGLWFTPTLVTFSYTDNSSGMGNGAMSSTSQWAFDVNSKTNTTSQCIYIRNGAGTAIWRAVFVSMDADWFTINVTTATGANISVCYTAIR